MDNCRVSHCVLTSLILWVCLVSSSCKKDEVVNPSPNRTAFSGISRADSTGIILSDDLDDWKPIEVAGMRLSQRCLP